MIFNGDMFIADIIQMEPRAINILESYGLHCSTCNGVFTGRLKDASRVHEISLDELLHAINNLENK